MITKVVMEALSPTMEEGRVVTWHKKEGDHVTAGDIVAEVETDKAVMELQARGDGILRRIVAGEGTTVEVGKLVAIIAAPDDDIGDVGATAPPVAAAPAAAAHPAGAEPAPPSAAPVAGTPTTDHVKASPLARRMAREQNVDLGSVRGSGPGGRIVKRDLEGAAPAPAGGLPRGGFEDVPVGQMRKTIAKRLAQSMGPVPHFFLTTEVDMERAAAAREELNALGDQRISFNDIVIKVVAMALVRHRTCNAWWQDDHIRYFDDVHMGMAVAVEDGLITPVIRNAHLKTLRDIAAESRALAERARERRLQPDEYTGGTFSISNLGMFGIDEFTAIINPPEAGIIAVGALAEKPVAANGSVEVRRRMRLTMSCDHRVIDGATGAQFLQTVVTMLENPMAMVW
jgi:pyruvate dehydrogenase E2 component (dihydrolipoamide acetyltransferase)